MLILQFIVFNMDLFWILGVTYTNIDTNYTIKGGFGWPTDVCPSQVLLNN